MTRIALGIQYDGAAFSGWQSQPHGNTVQDVLEAALREFAGVALPTTVAGRTDAGVHALGQVVHLDTELVRDPFSWVRGTNAFLPPTVAVRWAQAMPEDFHARFSAHRRTYYYALTYGPTRAPLLEGKAGYVTLPPGQSLDVTAMHEAAQVLVGEHDFSSFRAAECQAKSPVKTMYSTEVRGRANGCSCASAAAPSCITWCATSWAAWWRSAGQAPGGVDGRGAGRARPQGRRPHLHARRPVPCRGRLS